jgi:hypothetical protein
VRILRGLGSRLLSCGCLIGLYETYRNTTILIVDAVGSGCTDPTHRVNATFTAADPIQMDANLRLPPTMHR